MLKYGITKEFIENYKVQFDPYMHKALSHVMAPRTFYTKDAASKVTFV